MRRLLHIISSAIHPARDGAGARPAWGELLALRELARCDHDWQHVLLLLGSSADARDARMLGAEPDVRIAPLLGRPHMAIRGIERVIDELDPDAVVAWDPLFAPTIARLKILPERFARVDFARGEIECRGVHPETGEIIRHWRHLTPATLDAPPTGARDDLRQHLNLSSADLLIAVSGRAPETAMSLSFVLSALGVAGIPCVGLVHVKAPSRLTMLRHLREGGLMRQVIFTARPLPLLAPACDLVIHPLPDEEPMHLDQACLLRLIMRMGVPVLTRAEPALGVSAAPEYLLSSATPRRLAERAYHLLRRPDVLQDLRRRLVQEAPEGAGIGIQLRLAMRDLEALA